MCFMFCVLKNIESIQKPWVVLLLGSHSNWRPMCLAEASSNPGKIFASSMTDMLK